MAQIAMTAPAFLTTSSSTVRIARANHGGAVSKRMALTRRGRFVLIGLPLMLTATALLVLAGIFTAPVMAAGSGGTAAVDATTIAVMEGDTVWNLAAEFAPDRDRREVVAEITEMNDLRGSVLIPGEQIFVPSGS